VTGTNSYGVNIVAAQSQGQLIYVDAETTLAKFMVGGHPDEDLFNHTISEILEQAGIPLCRNKSFRSFVPIPNPSSQLTHRHPLHISGLCIRAS